MSTYFTNFSEYPTQTGIPSDWTNRYTLHASWSINEDAALLGGKYLQSYSTSTVREFISWNDIDGDAARADAEVLTKFRTNKATTNNYQNRVFVRADGNSTSTTQNNYYLSFQNGSHIQILKTVAGTATGLGAYAYTWTANTWYWIRFRVVGTSLKARIWADGEAEPTIWHIDVVDSEISAAGWVGIGGSTYATRQWDYFSVGTGGDTAPSPGGGGGGGGADEKTKVSSNDTTAGYLNGKLIAGVNVTLVENNDAGNETLTIDATAASGSTYSAPFRGALVQLSADQAITGNGAWQAVAWGAEQFDTDNFWASGSPTIFTIPAGITRAQLRAAAYLDDGNGWPLEMAIRNLTTGVDVAYDNAPGTSPMSVEVETPVMSVTAGHTYAVRLKSTADRTLSNGVLTWFAIEVIELQEATAPDGKLLVSSNDTTRGYLNGKVVAGTGITLTEGNDGADETLTVALAAQPHLVSLFIPGKPAASATITFAAASQTSFVSGDKLSVVSPAQDSTLADLGLTLRGTR